MKSNFVNAIIKILLVFMVLFLLVSISGCMHYYKVETVKHVTTNDIRKFDSLDKYFILHRRDSAWHLSSPVMTNNILSGELSVLPENRWKFLTTKPSRGNRYIKNQNYNQSYVLEEVHLYLQDSLYGDISTGDSIKIACSDIREVEVYQKAKGRTSASWIIPVTVGVPVVATGIFAIIAAAAVHDAGHHVSSSSTNWRIK